MPPSAFLRTCHIFVQPLTSRGVLRRAVLCCAVLSVAGSVVRFPHSNSDDVYAAKHHQLVVLVQASAIDLFLLSSTQFLIGTFYSSYTTTAELMSGTLAFRLGGIGKPKTPAAVVTARHWCQEAPMPSSPPPRRPS